MKLNAKVPVTVGLMAIMLVSATGCQRLRAADQLTKGVNAFKSGKFEDATTFFQNAVKIDPSYENAQLYLATTYASQIVPNLNTPENLKLAQKALTGFQDILVKHPQDLTALRQVASIHRITGHIAEAKEDEKKVIAVDPNNAEAFYTIGQVDWKEAYDNAVNTLKNQNPSLTDDGSGNLKMSKDSCTRLAAMNTPLVTEGTDYLQKAVGVNKTYEEAYTYLSLMARRKADLECGNDAARKADLVQSDMWAQKSMGARKENERVKEEKSHGVNM